MTPQEQQLVDELFDRLAQVENNPRDPDAERVIANGARRVPHAAYALVQTALVMDEALKRANARIEELQAQLGGVEQQQPGGFLDSMRDAVLGRRDPRGSVPNVRTQPTQPSSAAAAPYQSQAGYPPQTPPYPAGPGMGPNFGSGGSFLGTAASTAAGVIGGGLLLNSIRSMFGDHAGPAHAAGVDAVGRGGVAEKQRDQEQIRTRTMIKTTRTRPTRTKTKIRTRMTTAAILAVTIPTRENRECEKGRPKQPFNARTGPMTFMRPIVGAPPQDWRASSQATPGPIRCRTRRHRRGGRRHQQLSSG
jgi:hypothetical protein